MKPDKQTSQSDEEDFNDDAYILDDGKACLAVSHLFYSSFYLHFLMGALVWSIVHEHREISIV